MNKGTASYLKTEYPFFIKYDCGPDWYMGKDSDHEVVKRFLEEPRSRERFDAFFELCYRHILGFLGYLRARGFLLPIEQKSDRDPLSDLAIDVLGPFLQSSGNRPCVLVFDFFHRRGITDFKSADSVKLYDLFRSLLFGFTRQELSRLRKDADTQLDHLKRRFKDVLKGDEYTSFSTGNDRIEYIRLANVETDKHENRPMILYDRLTALVENAYHQSKSRKEWCRNIFNALNAEISVQNCLKKHELLSAVVTVNMKYVEVDALIPSYSQAADNGILKEAIEIAKKQTLAWLDKNVLRKFVQKDRITTEVADRFRDAAERYLSDLAHSPGVDLLPVYFREVMPENEHNRYLKDYKHIFETTIRKAEDDFKKRLRKNL